MRTFPSKAQREESRALKRTAEPERRPTRKGEKSEARRIEAGFRMLEGEGVYAEDDTDD